jgi:ATP/maltotriose-dependent transcriptional regulator MalT
LKLAQAWMAVVGGHVEAADMALEVAEQTSAQAAKEPFESSVPRGASLLANTSAAITIARGRLAWLRGDAEGTTSLASRACGELHDGDWLLTSMCQLELALADRLRGRLDDAERGFLSSLAGWRAVGERSSAVSVCDYLGQVHLAQGRLDAALATYQLALEIAAGPGQPTLPAAGIAYTGMAEVAYQRDELDAALRHVTEGIARLRPASYTAPLAAGLTRLSRIRQATGDAAGALEAIDEAERVAPSSAVGGLVNPAPAQRARLLLAQGNVAAATHWIQQRGLSPEDEPGYPQELEYLVLARILVAQKRPREGLALLDRLLAPAAAQDRTGSVIEIQAVRALAQAASGDEPAAVITLADALTLASPQGNVRVFADEGSPMRHLVRRIVVAHRAGQPSIRGIPFTYLARLVQAIDANPAMGGSTPNTAIGAVDLVDPLTGRELEVLAMLAVGTPNQAIAEQLFVTLFTVKKHVSHILGKLGAANRTEAVARARELGLIP